MGLEGVICSVRCLCARIMLMLQKKKPKLREEKERELWGSAKDFLQPADDWVQDPALPWLMGSLETSLRTSGL